MADNFVSWGDYMKLNGDQEQALLDNAMWSANNSQQGADAALRRAGGEATAAQMAEARNGGVAKTTLSGTASYRDYLRLKMQAEQQFAAAQMGPNRNSSLVRQQLAQKAGVNTDWTKRGDALEARAAKMAQAASEGATGYTRLASEAKTRNDAKTEAEAQRQKAFEESKGNYLGALVKGATGRAAAGGAQKDFVGGYNPFADSKWAQSQGGFDAAAAQRAGATPDQVRQIWNSYTGKGRWGSYQNQPGSDATLNRELDNWKGG